MSLVGYGPWGHQESDMTEYTHIHLTMKGQENSPAQLGGGADDGSMTSTEERQGSSSPNPSIFPLITKL